MVDLSRLEEPDDAVVEILRRMTPGERLEVASRMWVSARQIVEFVVRREHSNWTHQQVQEEVVRRMSSGAD